MRWLGLTLKSKIVTRTGAIALAILSVAGAVSIIHAASVARISVWQTVTINVFLSVALVLMMIAIESLVAMSRASGTIFQTPKT